MPLVKLQVRNEYGLGQPELYKETNREDPKAVLDGLAVAGLVGILRQLGDLADFAAEVFHGLQEQAMITANRSHKLMVRVQKIESSLPPLEKAVLAQTSHIHFAYTGGCEWHPRIKAKRNHFIYSDLPQFIMDSYEECRDPPRLHLLDKFDAGGPGSCLMRYSDPTFFKRVSAYSDEAYSEKFERARKSRKSKKKRSLRRKEGLRGEQLHNISGRMLFVPSTANRRTSSSQTASTADMSIKSDPEDRSNSVDPRAGADYIECVFHSANSMQPDDRNYSHEQFSSSRVKVKANAVRSVPPLMDDNISIDSLEKQNASSSSGVTWEEKEEIVEPMSQTYDKDKITDLLVLKQDPNMPDGKGATLTKIDYSEILFDKESNLKPVASVQTDEIDSEPDNYMDARNSIELESENDLDCETKKEVDRVTSNVMDGITENGIGRAGSNALDHNLSSVVSQTLSSASSDNGTGNDFPDPPQVNTSLKLDLCASKSEGPVNNEMSRDSDDSQDTESPIFEQTSSVLSVSFKKEKDGDFPDSLQVNPPPVSDFSVTKSESPVNEEMSRSLADSQVSERPVREEKPNICEKPAVACSVSTDSLSGAHALKDIVLPSIESEISLSSTKGPSLPDEAADRINSNICESKETPSESASDNSVRFWTNGGLLGLEPSKPPDFTTSTSISKVSLTTKTESDGGQYQNSMPKSNEFTVEQDLLTEAAKEIEKKPISRFLTAGREDQASTTEQASGIQKLSNEIRPSDGSNLEEIRLLAPGRVLSVSPNSKATSSEPNHGSGENSSRVFGLGQMLLMNSFCRKVSFDDEKSVPDGSLKSGRLEQRGQNSKIDQSLPETTIKEKVEYGYPIDSLPPSPPLEHMKISFHSVGGRETSKLKLRFPDGTNRHESTRDMFPSFQLVPEPSIPLHDSGFNSDDNDTFCRSSPYVSEDCPSPHSDCNSEEWESGESPESSDQGAYDFSHLSSTESPSSQELTGLSTNDVNVANGTHAQNGAEPSLSGRFLDFPSFDSVSPVIHKESSQVFTTNNIVKSQSQVEPLPPPPPPPPLPPVQWQVSKLRLHMTNDTQKYISGNAKQTKGLNLSESTISLHPRPAQMEQKLTNHDDHKSDGNISQKLTFQRIAQKRLNGKKEAHREVMGKEMVDKDDFLHQIRTKSFNLRPTVTGKPNATPSPPKNVKVTAILEKANAIRQVVASDDGEDDDNWSDT